MTGLGGSFGWIPFTRDMFIKYMVLLEQYSCDVTIAVVSKFDDVPGLTSLRFISRLCAEDKLVKGMQEAPA